MGSCKASPHHPATRGNDFPMMGRYNVMFIDAQGDGNKGVASDQMTGGYDIVSLQNCRTLEGIATVVITEGVTFKLKG